METSIDFSKSFSREYEGVLSKITIEVFRRVSRGMLAQTSEGIPGETHRIVGGVPEGVFERIPAELLQKFLREFS